MRRMESKRVKSVDDSIISKNRLSIPTSGFSSTVTACWFQLLNDYLLECYMAKVNDIVDSSTSTMKVGLL